RRPLYQRWRARLHRLVVQVVLDISRKTTGGVVATIAILLQRLHDDPVQLPTEQLPQAPGLALAVGRHGSRGLSPSADPRAGLGRLFLPDNAADLIVARLLQAFLIKRRGPGQ